MNQNEKIGQEYRRDLERNTLYFPTTVILEYNWKNAGLFKRLWYVIKYRNLLEAKMQLAIDYRLLRTPKNCYGSYSYAPDGSFTQKGEICKYLEGHYKSYQYYCTKHDHYFGETMDNCVQIKECIKNRSRDLLNQSMQVNYNK